MIGTAKQSILDFYTYPAIGTDDWRYIFETARVRALEMQMLSRSALLDMTNAENFKQAADLLASTEYALPRGGGDFNQVEQVLQGCRTAARQLFEDLVLDKSIVELFKARDDFANLRLAIRRVVTDRPIGTDYSADGNVGPGLFEEVLTEENYGLFPDYMQAAAEQAILAYYQNKQIPRIDYAIDRFQARYNLRRAEELKSVFLFNLFRIQIDLTNIRTMLRLKFTDSEVRNVFLEGGFIELERLENALAGDYESLGHLFFVTPHHQIVEAGANYLSSNKSFLALEQQCERYLAGFLATTIQITAGPQPIVAYLLNKENEIRTVRLILTAKKNLLDTKLILDRIA